MRILWFPEVLRAAGLTVHEYSGWRDRGSESWYSPRGVVCHATAGSRTSTDAAELRTIAITGSTSAPAPISQLYLSRSGAWTVVASGRCNHVKVGDKGPHRGYGNSYLIGVEAQNDNRGEPWPAGMVDSYQRGVAAILRRLGLPASRAVAHREHQSGKSDPHGIDMTKFRARVAALLAGEDDDMTPDQVRAEVRRGVHGLLDEAARRSTSTGRQLGDDLAVIIDRRLDAKLAPVLTNLAGLAGRDWVDEQQIVDGVLAGLGGKDLDEAAEALRAAFGDDRAAELGALLVATGGTAGTGSA